MYLGSRIIPLVTIMISSHI